MNEDFAIMVLERGILIGAEVMAPILFTGLMVGLLVGSFQAATQLSEPTLTFVPKVLAVGLVCGAIAPWALERLVFIFTFAVEQMPEVMVR